MPQLYVAIYHPRNGNVKHWSLYLEDNGIFEVVGDSMEFERMVRKGAAPQQEDDFIRNIPIADIEEVEHFVRVVENCEVRNQIAHWNCQDFVLDVLGALNDDDIVEDYDYNEAKDALERIFDQ